MRIAYTIFGHSALLTQDGLFSVLGGGVEWITAKKFPATADHLFMIVRLMLEPAECGTPRECTVSVTAPDGSTLTPSLVVVVNGVLNGVKPERESSFSAHFCYDGFTFPVPGD